MEGINGEIGTSFCCILDPPNSFISITSGGYPYEFNKRHKKALKDAEPSGIKRRKKKYEVKN